MRTGRQSELECFTLGLVWQLGPCSAYDVRRQLLGSPSTQWSGSAGAIYPLMQRLCRRRLLSARGARNGRRRRRVYSITPRGVRALRDWIGPPLAEEAVTVTYDPLRSRVRFLGVMAPPDRVRWVAAAQQSLGEVEKRVERWREAHAEGGDAFAAIINRHGELDLAWRRRWLEEVRALVKSG